MAARDIINLGTAPDSGTGDSARRGGEKINNLFADIYANFGDNPIGNDPSGPFYGYRRPFLATEYKVGELHPAGKYSMVRFSDSAAPVAMDTTYGYGVDAAGDWIDVDGDTIPDIYRDSEWYFLSRGESITADLTEVSTSGVVHLVLPLARAGDVIKVRDSMSTWGSKTISVWTTPYDFQTTAQVVEWKAATRTAVQNHPDSDALSIRQPDGEIKAVPFKRVNVPAAVEAAYPGLKQYFDYETNGNGKNISPINFYSKPDTELEFTYRGPEKGWVVIQRMLSTAYNAVGVYQDSFEISHWVIWDNPALSATIQGDVEIEIETGQYILPVSASNATGRVHLDAASTPTIKVFRRITETSTDTSVLNSITSWMRTKVQAGTLSAIQQERMEISLGEDSTGTALVNAGFVGTTSDNLYKEVRVSSIVDTSGNMFLISEEPFDGFVQIVTPKS